MSDQARGSLPADDAAPAPAAIPATVEMCLVLITRAREEAPVDASMTPTRELLLGVKRRGFGEGRVVAPGGKIDAGETPVDAARRELHEETSLFATALTPAGVLDFAFTDDSTTPDMRAHVFTTSAVEGVATTSEEIDVLWVPLDAIPYDRMWPDARHWLPRALAGTLRHARFTYAADGRTLTETSLA